MKTVTKVRDMLARGFDWDRNPDQLVIHLKVKIGEDRIFIRCYDRSEPVAREFLVKIQEVPIG